MCHFNKKKLMSLLCYFHFIRPRKSSLSYPSEDDEDDEDVEEEADEVVPDGVEEVELAKVNLEQKERERKLLLDDIRILSETGDIQGDVSPSSDKDSDLWMVGSAKPALVGFQL